jgi:hypothetical protein
MSGTTDSAGPGDGDSSASEAGSDVLSAGSASTPEVRVNPPAKITEKFDPDNPPPAVEGDLAVVYPLLTLTYQTRCSGDTPLPPLVTTNLILIVYLPNNASASLVAHEEGHVRVDSAIYQHHIEQFVGNAFSGFTGSGPAETVKTEVEGRLRLVRTLLTALFSQSTKEFHWLLGFMSPEQAAELLVLAYTGK